MQSEIRLAQDDLIGADGVLLSLGDDSEAAYIDRGCIYYRQERYGDAYDQFAQAAAKFAMKPLFGKWCCFTLIIAGYYMAVCLYRLEKYMASMRQVDEIIQKSRQKYAGKL